MPIYAENQSQRHLEILRRMTLIVGAIGKDGVVLAADTNAVQHARVECQFDDVIGIGKIVHLAKHGVAYAFAGDAFSEHAGVELNKSLDGGDDLRHTFDFSDIKISLERVGNMALHPIHSQHLGQPSGGVRQMLVVFYGLLDDPQLWRLDINSVSKATQIKDIAIIGTQGNPARFFRTYYEPYRPTEGLSRLAAQIVLSGHKYDSLAIGGLDGAVITKSDFTQFSEKKKEELREGYRKLDRSMVRQFIAGG
jgi:20S proteasome alpha/beta subunit